MPEATADSDNRFETREQMLKRMQNARILEIGGPSYPHTLALADRFKPSSLTYLNPEPIEGYDVSTTFTDRDFPIHTIPQRVQVADFPPDQFDIIAASQVFGKLGRDDQYGLDLTTSEKREAVLSKLHTWLRDGGLVIVEVEIPHVSLSTGSVRIGGVTDTGIPEDEWNKAGFSHSFDFDQGSTYYFSLKK
jgi:hypothetical protein